MSDLETHGRARQQGSRAQNLLAGHRHLAFDFIRIKQVIIKSPNVIAPGQQPMRGSDRQRRAAFPGLTTLTRG